MTLSLFVQNNYLFSRVGLLSWHLFYTGISSLKGLTTDKALCDNDYQEGIISVTKTKLLPYIVKYVRYFDYPFRLTIYLFKAKKIIKKNVFGCLIRPWLNYFENILHTEKKKITKSNGTVLLYIFTNKLRIRPCRLKKKHTFSSISF